MSRNIEFGSNDNLIPFNVYEAEKNAKGRLVKSDKVIDRIYCKEEQVNNSRTNIANSIRAVGYDAVYVTTSPNKIEEDFYIKNNYTDEVWRVVRISKTIISNNNAENCRRINYQYRLECVR